MIEYLLEERAGPTLDENMQITANSLRDDPSTVSLSQTNSTCQHTTRLQPPRGSLRVRSSQSSADKSLVRRNAARDKLWRTSLGVAGSRGSKYLDQVYRFACATRRTSSASGLRMYNLRLSTLQRITSDWICQHRPALTDSNGQLPSNSPRIPFSVWAGLSVPFLLP